MSVAQASVRAMDLTVGQRRTLDRLILHPGPEVPPGAAERLRSRIDDELGGLTFAEPMWLSKGRVEDLARCPGMLRASLRGEGEPFAHTPSTAAGTLMHRAVQLDVAVERGVDVRSVVERASDRLVEHDAGFAGYFDSLDALDRAERLADAAASLAMFREVFPPIPRSWQPVAEQPMRTRLAGGTVVLSGRLDLVLHFRIAETNLRAIYEQLLADDLNGDGELDSNRQRVEVTLTGQTIDEVFLEGFNQLDLFLAGKSLRQLLDELAAAGAI